MLKVVQYLVTRQKAINTWQNVTFHTRPNDALKVHMDCNHRKGVLPFLTTDSFVFFVYCYPIIYKIETILDCDWSISVRLIPNSMEKICNKSANICNDSAKIHNNGAKVCNNSAKTCNNSA